MTRADPSSRPCPGNPSSPSLSRRTFLSSLASTATGAVLFPVLLPSSALGKAGTTAPSERITMGCIGVGGQGTGNMRGFLAQKDTQVLAVCDVDKSHRDRAKDLVDNAYGNKDCATYNDFRELLERKDIDAVLVCTPDHWHALITVAAAKAGKDIYCEKPLSNTVAEGRAIADAVRRYERVLQCGSHERSRHNARFAAELVRNGRIGQLRAIRVNMPVDHEPVPPQPAMEIPDGFDYDLWLGPCPWAAYTRLRCHFYFRYVLDYSGGEMTDRGAHVLDLGQLAMDMDHSGPTEIRASGWRPETGLFNTFMKFEFEYQYPNGVTLVGRSESPRGIRFEGDEGWVFVHIHGGNLEAEPQSLLREQFSPEEVHLGRSPGHHRDFLNSMKSRTEPMAPVEAGHRTASLCHLTNIALLIGRPLKWDPVKEEILDDPEAQRMLSRPMRPPWHL